MIEISDFGLVNIQAPRLQALTAALELVYLAIVYFAWLERSLP